MLNDLSGHLFVCLDRSLRVSFAQYRYDYHLY